MGRVSVCEDERFLAMDGAHVTVVNATVHKNSSAGEFRVYFASHTQC